MRHLDLDGLRIILLVIMHPNSAFATIRDNVEKYFWWPVVGLGLSLAVWVFFVIAVESLLQHSDPLFLIINATSIAGKATSHLIFTVMVWLIGRAKGGTRQWRKVFSVLFYVWAVLAIPHVVLGAILFVLSLEIEDTWIVFELVIIIRFFLFGWAIWAVILVIKAINVVNKWYDTWKAVKVFILSLILVVLIEVLIGFITPI